MINRWLFFALFRAGRKGESLVEFEENVLVCFIDFLILGQILLNLTAAERNNFMTSPGVLVKVAVKKLVIHIFKCDFNLAVVSGLFNGKGGEYARNLVIVFILILRAEQVA